MAIREQIAAAVQIIVQQTRFACGTRKVTSITEITGMERGVNEGFERLDEILANNKAEAQAN